MSYNTRVTYEELRLEAEQLATQLENIMNRAAKAYDKYISFAAGRDAATIAADFAPGETVTETEVADLAAMFQTGNEYESFATNQAIAQGDRRYSWIKFF
jgi:hypothetical protein